MNVNKILVAGNLTRDPECRKLANDRTVANFSIAINERYKAKDGTQKENTTYVDVECWGRTAELVSQYLAKGRGVFVEGKLKTDSWEDKATKQKRTKLKVVADTVQFLSAPGKPTAGDKEPVVILDDEEGVPDWARK